MGIETGSHVVVRSRTVREWPEVSALLTAVAGLPANQEQPLGQRWSTSRGRSLMPDRTVYAPRKQGDDLWIAN